MSRRICQESFLELLGLTGDFCSPSVACSPLLFCQVFPLFLSAVEASLFLLHSVLLLVLGGPATGPHRPGPSHFSVAAPVSPGREVYAAFGVFAPLSRLPLSASFASPSRRALLTARVQELAGVHPELPNAVALMERLRRACSLGTFIPSDAEGDRIGARRQGPGAVACPVRTQKEFRKRAGAVSEGASDSMSVVAFLAERVQWLICSFVESR